jgi:hypothetical protein
MYIILMTKPCKLENEELRFTEVAKNTMLKHIKNFGLDA